MYFDLYNEVVQSTKASRSTGCSTLPKLSTDQVQLGGLQTFAGRTSIINTRIYKGTFPVPRSAVQRMPVPSTQWVEHLCGGYSTGMTFLYKSTREFPAKTSSTVAMKVVVRSSAAWMGEGPMENEHETGILSTAQCHLVEPVTTIAFRTQCTFATVERYGTEGRRAVLKR